MHRVIDLVNRHVMRAKDLLESRCQILEEMKSVGDLDGVRSPLTNTCGIGFGSITSDDLDIGMVLEPGGNGFSRPILEYVNRTATFEIDDDGAVAIAFTPCIKLSRSVTGTTRLQNRA